MQIPYGGAVVSVLLVALLLTPPGELVDRQGAYAAKTGDIVGQDAVPVELQDGLRSDPGEVIPNQLGAWNGTDDTSWPEELDKWLAYDELLVRDYERDGFYFPVQLMVLTARHSQAFHDPQICFDVQGGNVKALEDTTIEAPGPAEVDAMTVGRLHITYTGDGGNESGANATRAPPKLVHNLYIVERHDAAADRTTWIRLTMAGVGEDAIDDVTPRLNELMERVAPYLFHATGEDRTVAHWVRASYGTGGLATAVSLAAAPLLAHGAWLWRLEHREGDADHPRADAREDQAP